MRTNLNDITTQRLLEVMEFYEFTSTNHTLNIIVGSLHQSLFPEQYTKPTNTHPNEVNTNDQHQRNQH